MKILIITRSAWDESNSTGNTMSNFFSGYDKNKLANIYFRSAKPNNNVCKYYFSISDNDVFKSLYKYKYSPGISFESDQKNNRDDVERINESIIYKHFRGRQSILALWGQDMMWKIGRWKSKELNKFLDWYQPDVIFSPSFHTSYTHRMLWYIQNYTGAEIALFHADDYLSINEHGSNILEKLYQINRSKVVKKSISKSKINYCISNKQLIEYQEKTGVEMTVLYKGACFHSKPTYILPKGDDVIKIVYVGSVLYGRWTTLSILAKKISEINKSRKYFELIIYSQYELTNEMKKAIIIEGSSKFEGKLSPNEIQNKYSQSDIVLHVESFDDPGKTQTRLSFSTKIVDCLKSGRTLLAIGWGKAASIDYLYNNDAALIATNEDEISDILESILLDNNILKIYANKSWKCGKSNHQLDVIQSKLYEDLKGLR